MDPEANLKNRLLELEKLDEQRQRALWEQEVAQRRMKVYHDKTLKEKRLKEGDLALWFPGSLEAKKKNLTIGWTGPYQILRIYENGSVRLMDLQGLELPERVNMGKLRKYHIRDQDSEEKTSEPQSQEKGHDQSTKGAKPDQQALMTRSRKKQQERQKRANRKLTWQRSNQKQNHQNSHDQEHLIANHTKQSP